MNPRTQFELISGPVGSIEVAIDAPAGEPRGLAVVCHPHPLFGGTLDNKVTQTLARALVALGFVSVRPNFRGVGNTAGTHDEGRGEVDDIVTVVDLFRQRYQPKELVLAGFSFGSFVQTHVAQRLAAAGIPAQRLVLVGTATSRWQVMPVPEDSLVIHGELDDTVPLSSVLDWARPQNLPVTVIPGADHFFHGRLPIIKRLVIHALSSGLSTHHV
ncbi:MAG: alpha/beta fold hydrolase [Burkholderiales bacterium]|jgi:alpha/beta superfamily hydrolase|nr:alpha/beta fold hydrolase [Burkholderiales bacterium]MCA3154760.1 alpha/beta fold hydrolase [Burkholderiales bacterium]MCA3158845.1 alpha/beta fold hydrolase [Burkholderiales bacterium]MCA3162029.1 alpha/beta fold hydrolase [Burkholderiales bacterium]MCA3164538.1 alpha/beta fold hydrolase [Burkholderiales bacterium]